ncbi:hypothetical protein [Sandaracinus amylolyticus]|uniref:hypothetical protein n=1 Tax=Sandaracinus amylolyticus TaxID=927083 RepID=UPI001F34250E|nr:hypothetical protein [Sandaracinus amylolyticus]UJR78158.1 Tryptophan synthase alpha chain [Sandaracinus amylolyticus]
MSRPLAVVALSFVVVMGCEAEGFRIRDTGVRIDPPECFELGDCDDGIDCTSEDCIGLRCFHGRPPGFCPGSACVPDLGACASAIACTSDLDCADDDPCTADERCELGACAVRYLGDRDGDGDLQPECGGGDCDDDDPRVSVYAAEGCDGRDDDCDRDVDERSCGLGECLAGACVCPEGTSICDGVCVDTRTDVEHCGGCGVACPTGGVCEGGACRCPIGLELCEEQNACNTIGTSVRSCGVCRVSCDDGTQCIDGECLCPDDFLTCRGLCVDPRTDREHCGACGVSCQWCEECVEGACVPRADATLCDGRCTQIAYDERNCGACSHACAPAESCSGGECTCNGTYCDGVCSQTWSDAANCGACGNACAPGARCDGGQCGCVPCDASGARCADVALDADHCGGCDLACPAGQGCVDGGCVTTTSCVARRGGSCGDEVLDLRPAGSLCASAAYEWCPRTPGIAGVVRLDDLDTSEVDRTIPLAIAAARQGVCVATLGWLPEWGTHGARSWCFDPQGRSTGASIAMSGARAEAVLDVAQQPSGSWMVSTREEAGVQYVSSWWPGGALVLRGDAVLGEGLARVPRGPVIAGTFSGTLGHGCGMDECLAYVTARGARDGYVAFFDSESSVHVVGGRDDDALHAIATLDDDVVVAGLFRGTWDELVSRGERDALVARMRSDGTYTWRVGLGGTSFDEALRVVTLPGRVIVAGFYSGSITLGGVTHTARSGTGVFVVALDAATGAHLWSHAIDASPWIVALDVEPLLGLRDLRVTIPLRLGLAASPAHGVALAATFAGTIDVGGTSVTSAGSDDVLLARFTADGAVIDARALGGPGRDAAADVAIDETGTAWIAAHLRAPMSIGPVTVREGAVLIGVLP